MSFQLHEELAEKLKIESYRKLPVLSVSPGKRSSRVPDLCEWLDGEIEDIRLMDPNGAQVAPLELCTKLIDAAVAEGAELLIGAAEGVETQADGDIERVTGGGYVKTFADVMHSAVFVPLFCFGSRIELDMNYRNSVPPVSVDPITSQFPIAAQVWSLMVKLCRLRRFAFVLVHGLHLPRTGSTCPCR